MTITSVSRSGVVKDNTVRKEKFVTDDSTASLAGWFGGSTIGGVAGVSAVGVLAGMKKYGQIPSDDTIDVIHKASEKAIKLSGMDSYGVNIKYLKPPAKKASLVTILGNTIAQIRNGYNACFLPKEVKNVSGTVAYKKNTILMPEKGIAFASFHEIGHSINANKSLFWKTMQRMRKSGVLISSVLLLYGAFTKNEKSKDGKELSDKKKANNFVRDNIGKLTFASMLPMLSEEAMATIRGQKLANKLLDKKIARYVFKGNALAYSSYLLSAGALALGSNCAVKIKDNLIKKDA